MKNNFFLIICLAVTAIFKVHAQTPAPATVDSVTVKYKAVTQSPGTLQNKFRVKPQVTIKLNDPATVSKIYVKLYKTLPDSLIYEAQYELNSPAITDAAGNKLYEKIGNYVFISPAVIMPLRPYKFKIQTEDNLQVKSTIFNTTQ